MNNVWVILVLLLSGALQAQTVVLDELPKRMILPCERELPVSKLTRAIIPMIPWRGINLAFPFELEEGTTNYTLSGGDVWAFDKAMKGSNIVTLTFKKFDQNKNWGTVQDFTISTPNYVFSFALHAVKDPSEHCTNIRLTLSDAERKRLLKEKKQSYRETLDQEYAAQFAALDNTAEERALLMVGSLAQRKPDRTRIKEEGSLRLSNGDELVVYVKNSKTYGTFSTLSFDIENHHAEKALYIESLFIKQEGRAEAIKGASTLPKKVKAGKEAEVVFVTREALPETGLTLQLKTKAGHLEVKW
ncbi:MAG: hypothetical protein KUG83_04860 [Gammaproteobacteria bacterium]|nr:hypothetical protein [Gammaproteobacteria bacterium]